MPSPLPTTAHGGATSISEIHPDIIRSHILTKLDGPSLASAASSSPLLHLLCTETELWSDLCTATWPSSSHPRVQAAIATFPDGHRSYFTDSFPTLDHHLHRPPSNRTSPPPPPTPELISAVDLHYKNKLMFSKVEVTETASDWFVNSPFRVDLLDQKETVATPIIFDGDESTCLSCIKKNLTLSWVLIDPTGKRSVNLSSLRPVFVKRHWLTGHVQVMYNTILSRDHQCKVEVILGGNKEGGELSVWEVSMRVEDVEGKCLNGRGSLVILQEGVVRGGRRKMRVGEERERYEEYLEMKREKAERERRREKILDMVCLASGVVFFVCFWGFILLRRGKGRKDYI